MTGKVARRITNLALATAVLFVLSNAASAATCDRTCLLEQAKQFNANMLAHTTEKIPLAANANIRENTKAIALGDSKWIGVAKILSEGVYADPILGNVIEHIAAETAAGKTVYIGTRLKLVDRKIKEVEINFDDGPRVNIKNLVPYDPIFKTIVPAEERSTREELRESLLPTSRDLLTTIPFNPITTLAATATTAETALRITRGMALRRAATSAAMRAILDRSRGGQQPRYALDWSIRNAYADGCSWPLHRSAWRSRSYE